LTVRSHLRPAGSSAAVVVSALKQDDGDWESRSVEVATNGSFVASWDVPRDTTRFIAQWSGNFSADSAGSRVLEVTVAAKPKARARRGGRAKRR